MISSSNDNHHYLSNRRQRVVVDDQVSRLKKMLSVGCALINKTLF